MGGMVSQNIMNLVDTAMVGSLGDGALAAVGLAGFTMFTCAAFIIGISTGVQATSARWLGAGRTKEIAVPLNGGLLLVLLLGIPMALSLFFLAPGFFPLLSQDANVATQGTLYLQARLVGLIPMGTNFVFRGYWNAVNLSAIYMRTIIIMNVTNIFLNWVLIFGNLGAPELGVLGAGIGTTTALLIGSITYLITATRRAREGGFLVGWPDWATLWTLTRLSVPAGIQHVFFALGMTFFFWILGSIGTAELAAGHVLSNLLLLWMLLSNGFGLAAASLVGQALGAGDAEDARAWAWQVVRIAMVFVSLLALPAVLVPDLFLGLFLRDLTTLALARLPLQITAITMGLEVIGMVLMNAHYGAGHSRRVMVISLAMQWCFFLPIAFLMGSIFGFGLLAIWSVNIGYRLIQSGVFVWSWESGSWAKVRI